ncbi:MAG: transposase InsO family protein [Gammaproteobacteria bacterium]|jgi:transposase InsO family protein
MSTNERFHAHSGSEFINHRVARLLNKLLIELTKSRPRHSNDNALAESKNGTVIRKHFGYEHTPRRFAAKLNDFHRPYFFPVTDTDPKGKQRRRYPYEAMMTPSEKLKPVPNAATYLRHDLTFETVDAQAHQINCNDAAG